MTESRRNGPGQQTRSRVTQDLVLDATSVQDVAKRADRSIESLYHHFETKETVVGGDLPGHLVTTKMP